MAFASQDDLESPLESPSSPNDLDESPLASSTDTRHATLQPSLASASATKMSVSSTPLGNVNAARRPPVAAKGPNAEMLAKLNAFSLSRSGVPGSAGRAPSMPASPAPQSPGPGNGFPAGFRLPPGALQRPSVHSSSSSPALVGAGRGSSLAAKRGINLPGGLPTSAPQTPPTAGKKNRPNMKLSDLGASAGSSETNGSAPPKQEMNKLQMYSEYIDAERGALTFKNKAVVHSKGIDFSSGRSFSISLDEVDSLGELGKGNYGTVYKVRHSRPTFRQPGQGVAKARRDRSDEDDEAQKDLSAAPSQGGGTTGVVMAMKEMRLELEDTKFAQIIMELDILHRCISPYIVDFYGAFFQEGAVYICMEWMDGGSVDKLYFDGIPENVLKKITYSTVMGLKGLKEGYDIIHRDVKPTNILINTRGQVKICDFGVSGKLVASIAKTNIGCQSYMAPERISSGGMSQAGASGAVGTYSIQSDIWSLGLTIIECALGHYPYPPETYENIFSQLSAIVDGDPPDLPSDQFSEAARDFVAGCLNKIPNLRPTYPMLLQHEWLAPLDKPPTIVEEDEEAVAAAEAAGPPEPNPEQIDTATTSDLSSALPGRDGFHDREVGEWVINALERRRKGLAGSAVKPALHAAPLDATLNSPGTEVKPVAVDA